MRARLGLVACVVFVGLVVFGTYEPRLHHTFPSMVDDWSAILKAPDQLRAVLRLENPEEQRYRPGFIGWNALQWHTLGAPHSFAGPQFWGLLRVAALIVGITLLARLLIRPEPWTPESFDVRWLLTAAVPLAIITIPGTAVDLARFGPQEPLMVGCLSLGAVLLVRAIDGLLDARHAARRALVPAAAGLLAWWFGVLQKETSICVLVLAPFLWPTIRSQSARWRSLDRARRAALSVVAVAITMPFVPMLARSVQLALAESRVYEDVAAQGSFAARFADQLTRAWDTLLTPLFVLLALAAIVVIVSRAFSRGVDWLSVGLVVTGFAFVAFAAESGVVTSRYYLPPVTLFALALARAIASFGARAVLTTCAALLVTAVVQAPDARRWVGTWVVYERAQEALIRASAARASNGCAVSVTGTNLELVTAYPVLAPFADVAPTDCHEGDHFVTVIDWRSSETTADDAILALCGSRPVLVWENRIGRIVRCEPRSTVGQRTSRIAPTPTRASPATRGAVSSSPRITAAPIATVA